MGQGALKKASFISQAGMEVCWLQALAAFMLFAFFKHHISPLFVIFIYFSGVTANFFCYSRPLLKFQVFLLKTTIFSASFFTATNFFLLKFGSNDFSLTFSELFSFQKPLDHWFLAVTLLLIAGITWRRSTIHILRPLTIDNVYNRLDLGIGVFFALLVVKLMLFGRFDLIIPYPDLKTLYLPFFFFCLLTIALMFSAEGNDRQYTSGFQKLGVAFSFIAVMLSAGAGIVFLFHGQMRASAEVLSGILKKAGPPLESAVIWLARFLWSPKHHYEKPPMQKPEGPNRYADLARGVIEDNRVLEVVEWGGLALLLLAIIFLLYVLVRILLRYLLRGTDPKHRIPYRAFDVTLWLKRFLGLLRRLLTGLWILTKGANSAKDLFRGLVSWGRRSGIACRATETPMEYGAKLSTAFPELSTEIETIIQLFYREIYGEYRPVGEQIASGKKALTRMARPAFWKDRLKSWILSVE